MLTGPLPGGAYLVVSRVDLAVHACDDAANAGQLHRRSRRRSLEVPVEQAATA